MEHFLNNTLWLFYFFHTGNTFIPWSRVTQLMNKIPVFIQPKGSLSYSLEPATGSYPDPLESSPHHHILHFLRSVLILFSQLCLHILIGLFTSGLVIKILYVFLITSVCATCPLAVISYSLELVVEYCPGHKSIELWWFHPVCAGPYIPAFSVCHSGFHCRQLYRRFLTCGFQVKSSCFCVLLIHPYLVMLFHIPTMFLVTYCWTTCGVSGSVIQPQLWWPLAVCLTYP